MRRFSHTRYIPENAEPIEHPDGLGVVYIYTDHRGRAGAIAYWGKSNRSLWNYIYPNSAQRSAKIADLFESMDSHKESVAARRLDRKKERAKPIDGKTSFTAAETAALLRQALKRTFPGVKFSVVSDTYSGGASVDVSYTDGPLAKDVSALASLYSGGGFDGMIDMKYSSWAWMLPNGTVYHGGTDGTTGSMGSVSKVENEKPDSGARRVHFGADHVFVHRNSSAAAMRKASKRVAEECRLPELEIKEDGQYSSAVGEDKNITVPYKYFADHDVIAHDSNYGTCHEQLIYEIARCTSDYSPITEIEVA